MFTVTLLLLPKIQIRTTSVITVKRGWVLEASEASLRTMSLLDICQLDKFTSNAKHRIAYLLLHSFSTGDPDSAISNRRAGCASFILSAKVAKL